MVRSRNASPPARRDRTISSNTAIRLSGVTKRFSEEGPPAVDDLSLEIPRGSLVALIGPSGCGKTTTLRMINRLIEPTSGSIEIDGEDVTTRPVAQLRRDIGYVIQQVGLFPHRTIGQNIATVPKTLGWDKQRTAERLQELAVLVGLDDGMLDRYPDELSGGQQQRVGVARALAADPPVLLMDEPFGAVDPIVRSRLQDELLDLQEQVHKTIVLVTHDLDEALKLADRIAMLNVGGILEQYAAPDEFLRSPANEFVESFVGDDRGVKRLQLASVGELPFDRGPVVEVTADAAEARRVMDDYRVEWVGILEGDAFLGWVSGDDLADGRLPVDAPRAEPASLVTPDSTLRNAMELIMTSDSAVAVIDDGGRFGGVVTLEALPRPAGPRSGSRRSERAVTGVLAEARNPLLRWEYIVDEWDRIQEALIQHLQLTLVSVALGFLLSSVLAAMALRFRWATGPITGFTGFLYTIPSIALFALLVPYFGLTRTSAVIPLTLYTLLILVTNIIAGFRSVPNAVREAADGMGLTPTRRVLTVELPLAVPYIITGLRIAMVSTVGLVTIAAIIGQGGLGRLILDGLRRAFWTPDDARGASGHLPRPGARRTDLPHRRRRHPVAPSGAVVMSGLVGQAAVPRDIGLVEWFTTADTWTGSAGHPRPRCGTP